MTFPAVGRLCAIGLLAAACGLTACAKGQQSASSTAAPTQSASASSDFGPPESVASAAPAVATAQTSPAVADPLASVHFNDIAGTDGEIAIKQLAALGVIGAKTGDFHPHAPLSRAEYVRWLVKASNAYFADNPKKRIRLSETNESSFVDVPPSNPDFKYIQGMSNAGFLIGYDKTHFKPNKNLSREELLAILITRDQNGSPGDTSQCTRPPAQITDGNKVSKAYWCQFGNDIWDYGMANHDNLHRIFGATKTLQPQANATREDAAVALQLIDGVNAGDVLKKK